MKHIFINSQFYIVFVAFFGEIISSPLQLFFLNTFCATKQKILKLKRTQNNIQVGKKHRTLNSFARRFTLFEKHFRHFVSFPGRHFLIRTKSNEKINIKKKLTTCKGNGALNWIDRK